MKVEENKKEVKFIVFRDDDDKVKEKYAFVKEDEFWVEIQLYDITSNKEYGEMFKVPRERVLKIKEVKK